MFNRNNYPSVPSPFASRPNGSPRPPPRDPYASANQGPAPPRRSDYGGYDQAAGGGGGGAGYDTQPSGGYGAPQAQRMPARRPVGGGGGQGQQWQLRPAKSPSLEYTFGNLVAVSPFDFQGGEQLLRINDMFVVSARPLDGFPQGQISMNDAQRTWMSVAMTDSVTVEIYDPFSQGGQAYLGDMDIEVGFGGTKKRPQEPYDQDKLAQAVQKNFANQVLSPGQRIMMDLASVPLLLVVKTVQVVDLTEKGASKAAPTQSDPNARGILTTHTNINFFKDAKTGINLKASNRRPAANSIIAPDFKFETMGIGGLDAEFSTIFRRAFASRIFPPGLVDKLGIQHVKGILLYGPPGTGKTLIARQIGTMLNARPPKIINGPEVLNKYVGQSEENIRKLFADAEKEYKEKGDSSSLHIIIFDELDAVCKQRGSGAGGGTGVGDSVVNQLLSKLDGVDQLNNILLIGMTNRFDMIDDALLRPGRLEVHLEISLPSESGRVQILKIHTERMRKNDVMDHDVDLAELAHLTKNFSGAEIGGLVKSASSFAFNRHVKVGTVAGVSDDIVNMKVNRTDFHNALDEVKAAFGVSEEELASAIRGGIIPFSSFIPNILEEGRLSVQQVRKSSSTPLVSVLLHGPPGAGKTALAARIALDSGYPFIKLVSPESMLGYSEAAKINHLTKVFTDAYKSPLSVIVVDDVEQMADWNPIGPRFSNPVLQTIKVLLRKPPPNDRKLLILATTTQRSVLQQLDIFNAFDSDIPVPNIMHYAELEHVMRHTAAFSDQDLQRSLAEIREYVGRGGEDKVDVGVKKVLMAIYKAQQDSDMAVRFAGTVARAVDERRFETGQ